MTGRKLRGILNILEAFVIPMIVAMYGMGAGYLLRNLELKGILKLEQAFLNEIREISSLAPMQISYSRPGASDEIINDIFYNKINVEYVDYQQRRTDVINFFKKVCQYHYLYSKSEFCRSFMRYIRMVGE